MIEKQFTMYVQNRAGSLAKTARALAVEKVNIEGISVAEMGDLSIIQLITNDAKAAQRALKKAGISFGVQDVIVAHLEDKPGQLASLASRLEQKGVNVNYLYSTSSACECGKGTSVVISAADLKKAEATIRGAKAVRADRTKGHA